MKSPKDANKLFRVQLSYTTDKKAKDRKIAAQESVRDILSAFKSMGGITDVGCLIDLFGLVEGVSISVIELEGENYVS